MTAFASLILLIIIAALAMSAVAYANHTAEKNKAVSLKLQKMKLRVEELEDVVLLLDGLCEKRMIPKLVNDEIISSYHDMIALDPTAGYLEAGLTNAQLRSNELSDELAPRHISRICKSDAQIARCQTYLTEALRILRKQSSEGKVGSDEIQDLALHIDWLQLQVKVITNIAQGHKAYNKQDVLSANAFYKKAQTELMRSSHPDERRHKMITQVADILFGRRKSLDSSLMPETEFNPEETISTTEETVDSPESTKPNTP